MHRLLPLSSFCFNDIPFRFAGIAALLVVLVLGVTACGDDPVPTEPAPPDPDPAPAEVSVTLEGAVTDAESDDAVEDAAVAVYLPGSDNELDATTTGEDGTYSLAFTIEENDAPDEVHLRIEADGFNHYEVDLNFSESISHDAELEPEEDDVIEASAAGTVSDENTDDGIEGATVTGTDADTGDELFETTTGSDGSYDASFEVADEPSEVVVSAEASGYEPAEESVSFDSEMTVDLELAPETTQTSVSGTVIEQGTGYEVEGATVTGTDADTGDELFETTTGSDGSYDASFEVTVPNAPDEVLVETGKEKYAAADASVVFGPNITADFELAWAPPFEEDCNSVDPDNLDIEPAGDEWRLVDGTSWLMIFEEYDNARKARDIAQFYGFTNRCFVGRPDAPMDYWLVEGTPPRAEDDTPFDEDCIGVDPDDLSIEQISGDRWRVRSGSTGLLIFDEYEDAQKAKDVIEFYGFTNICFVERPEPPMMYWLR